MAPKKNARDATASASVTASPAAAAPVKPSKASKKADEDAPWYGFVSTIWNYYWKETSQPGLMIDIFMAFLVLVGGLQALYFVLGGRYPFNAFIAGFAATVGQFVLTASLRMQTVASAKTEFPKISPERSFADYIFGSLILHFFCINYIN